MSVDRTERLLNLVICLLAASRPVSRESLRSLVPGYEDSVRDEAFQRKFERDKDDLRSLGIPVETVTTAEGEVLGYRIPRDEYRLPAVTFTTEQWALLGIAARAWADAALAEPAIQAVRKLQATSSHAPLDGGSLRDVVVWQPRPNPADVDLPLLWDALRRRVRLSFDYVGRRDTAPRRRSVEPWAVIARHGGWYLVGRDTDLDDARVFRTSRIVGGLALVGAESAYEIPPTDVSALVQGHGREEPAATAIIALAPGRGGRLRTSGAPADAPPGFTVPDSWDTLVVSAPDMQALVADIAGAATQVRVLAPGEVSAAVRASWRLVRDAHRDPRWPDDDGTAS